MKQKKKKLTVRGIAAISGFSPATISRALNGAENVNNETSAKIQAIIEEHGGYKNTRKKKTSSEKNIIGYAPPMQLAKGFTLAEYTNHLLFEEYLENAARKEGFNLLISRNSETEKSVDASGIIYMGGKIPRTRKLPAVAVSHTRYSNCITYVDNDFITGYVKMLQHLKKMGHSRIGVFLDRERQTSIFPFWMQHLEYIFNEAEIEYDDKLIWNVNFPLNNHDDTVKKAVDYFISLPSMPTAIVLCGDVYAPAFYRELKERGLKIPDDISLTGQDDINLCEVLDPTLTSLRPDWKKIAEETVRLLMAQMESPRKTNCNVLVEPSVTVRESVKDISDS